MTRVSVYSSALAATVAATAMTIASLATPNWVTYSVTTAKGETFDKNIGLHKSCSNIGTPACRDFPSPDLCQGGGRFFCSMWRSVGFMASFATVLCLACLVAFLVIVRGGKYKRQTGWPFVTAMLSLVSVIELAMISFVAYLYDHDDQFSVDGWKLDFSWYLSTISAVFCLLSAVGLALSAYLLPPEEGYEFLEDPDA